MLIKNTRSKSLDTSKKIPLTSNGGIESKKAYIS